MVSKIKKIQKKANEIKEEIKDHKKALVVSHIDTDGLCAAGIISKTLKRENIRHNVKFVKSLDEKSIKKIGETKTPLVIFTDLGSGNFDTLTQFSKNTVILDHHEPISQKTNLDNTYQLNPHLFGVDGASELSGSGTAFFFSRAFSKKNEDLADLAIIGGVGDLQDSKFGKLKGLNRKILKIGSQNDVLNYKKDLKIYGKQTKPIHKLLEYSSDPYIPGISGNGRESLELLKELDIDLKNEKGWRKWIDLTKEEKRKIISKLMHYCLVNGVPKKEIERMIGEVYVLKNEEKGTELRDASEFSTLLNATARYEKSKIGLKICLGNRKEAYKKAKKLLRNHRKNIVNGLSLIEENIEEYPHLQFFHGKDKIRDTIVGIIAGMAYNTPHIDRKKPIIAFANKNEEEIKVSGRATQKHINNGLNLGDILRKASKKVGGSGGGHNIAAGATIPKGKEKKFLSISNKKIEKQLNNT
ncbi:recombinase RecJ [archaeon SCG-AAA382B04]|nr:recombinase RecJ [archaeon SCG-AAA382B04]